jgi:glycosyltransferase involved in cell wall biosynthesis
MPASRPDGPGAERAPRVAFVGLLGGDRDFARNPAYSVAGAHFQERLIGALGEAGLPVDHVFALRPVASFPRTRRLWLAEERGAEIAGRPATLIPFVNVGPVKPLSVALALVPRLVRWARETPPDRGPPVILMYNVQNPPGVAGVLAARLAPARFVPVVADVQIPGSGLVPDTLLRRAEFAAQRWALARASGLVVLTERIGEDFAPAVPRLLMEGAAPGELLPGAALPPEAEAVSAELARALAEEPHGRFTLMYAGGFNDLKGVPVLLEAFARLRGDHYRLWLTGGGPLQPAVEAAAVRDARIRFWGFPPYADVLALYRRAAVLVNPHSASHASARYVFPSKLIEYLATGTPVVSTVSTPEVAREYGHVLVAARDDGPDAVAQAVRELEGLAPADRAALGARARAFVAAEKSWLAQATRIAAFVRAAGAHGAAGAR